MEEKLDMLPLCRELSDDARQGRISVEEMSVLKDLLLSGDEGYAEALRQVNAKRLEWEKQQAALAIARETHGESYDTYLNQFPWIALGSLVELQVTGDWYVGKVLNINLATSPSVKIAYRREGKNLSLIVPFPSWRTKIHALSSKHLPGWLVNGFKGKGKTFAIQYLSQVSCVWREGTVVDVWEFGTDTNSSKIGCVVHYREGFQTLIRVLGVHQLTTALRLPAPRMDRCYLDVMAEYGWIHAGAQVDMLVDGGFYLARVGAVDIGCNSAGTKLQLTYRKGNKNWASTLFLADWKCLRPPGGSLPEWVVREAARRPNFELQFLLDIPSPTPNGRPDSIWLDATVVDLFHADLSDLYASKVDSITVRYRYKAQFWRRELSGVEASTHLRSAAGYEAMGGHLVEHLWAGKHVDVASDIPGKLVLYAGNVQRVSDSVSEGPYDPFQSFPYTLQVQYRKDKRSKCTTTEELTDLTRVYPVLAPYFDELFPPLPTVVLLLILDYFESYPSVRRVSLCPPLPRPLPSLRVNHLHNAGSFAGYSVRVQQDCMLHGIEYAANLGQVSFRAALLQTVYGLVKSELGRETWKNKQGSLASVSFFDTPICLTRGLQYIFAVRVGDNMTTLNPAINPGIPHAVACFTDCKPVVVTFQSISPAPWCPELVVYIRLTDIDQAMPNEAHTRMRDLAG